MDGYLKIKTKLDNKGIDKDINELENRIKKLQTDNSRLSNEQNNLEEQVNQYNKLIKKAEEYKQKMASLQVMKNGKLEVTDRNQMLNLQALYSTAKTEIDKQASKINKVYANLEKVKTKQSENNAKISEFKQKIDQINIAKVQNGLNSVGKNIQNQISKIGKMAMAVIGVKSAWNAVRSAVNIVQQYNPQIAADFEYMRYCIANTLVPAVQNLIKLLYTVLSYVNAITSAWFGINLFENASVKNFKKMQSSASGTAKSAKEIQKSLQSFDEMNVLQDNSNTASESGGGVATPSMDLSAMQGEVPGWLKWIVDNKDLILSVMAGVATGLLAWKLGLDGITSLGIGVLIAGIVYSIQALLDYLENPTFINLGKFIQGIGVAILGLALIIGNLPLSVIGAITLIWGTIVKYWEDIKAFFQGGIDWLKTKSDWVHEMFGDTIGDIYDTIVINLQGILDWFDSLFQGIKANFNEIISFIKNVFSGNWKGAWENIKNIFKNIWEFMRKTAQTVWNLITSMVSNMGKTAGNIISSAFKAIVNAVLRTIENVLNSPIRAINGLIGVINMVPGVNLGKLNTFSLPRLAKGTIVAQPTAAIIGEAGKEAVVPLENNTEWIDILADKLASKMENNGGVNNIYLDGRLIQRQIERRKEELAFATNR